MFTIRYILHIVGTLNSYCAAVEYGGNHFKHLEFDQIQALKSSKCDFDAMMSISQKAREDLMWWKDNVTNSSCKIKTGFFCFFF